jgi:hypothetical protein
MLSVPEISQGASLSLILCPERDTSVIRYRTGLDSFDDLAMPQREGLGTPVFLAFHNTCFTPKYHAVYVY